MNFYFGCWSQAGHYLHAKGGATVITAGPLDDRSADDCDRWCPAAVGREQDERLDRLTHIDHPSGQWSVWAMWDRTIDTRPGCFALFLCRGTLTRTQCYNAASVDFPHIVGRLKARRVILGGDLPWPETVF